MGDSPRHTILIVETNKAFRRKMVSTLRNLGFATLEAGASDAALAKFQAHQMQIDLAIIELEIPSVSGLDLAAELERLRPGINVLYMSALHESIAMESIARRSPERVMLKPFDPSALAERARQLLTRVPPSDNGQARSASSRE